MTDRAFNDYLVEKIVEHVFGILKGYIENPDDVCVATWEVIDAVEQEITWANGSGNRNP